MNPMLVFSVLSALTAAVWSVWTWREEQQKDRQVKRDQDSALFVNSYILAAEELQTRLYSILEEDELAFYKKQYPEQYEFGSPYAIEILYRLSQFLGWAQRNFRYGPYTNDPRAIELHRQIVENFEDRSKFPGDAFRFTIDEIVSLGGAVVKRIGDVTALRPTFESITFFEFQQEMNDESSKHVPLFQSRAVRSTLAAIDRSIALRPWRDAHGWRSCRISWLTCSPTWKAWKVFALPSGLEEEHGSGGLLPSSSR